MLTGYTESYLMYSDLIKDLFEQKYSIFIMDHRGMGKSGRMLPNRQIVHVVNFDDYVNDAEFFTQEIARRDGSELPLYLFGHSTDIHCIGRRHGGSPLPDQHRAIPWPKRWFFPGIVWVGSRCG